MKENKKTAHQLETCKDKLRQLEGEKLLSDPSGGAGDSGRYAHARGQPEGSNEVNKT